MRTLIGTLLLLVIAPSAASAATIHASQPWRVGYATITYTAGNGERNAVSLSTSGSYARLDDPGAVIFSTDSAVAPPYCLATLHTGLCSAPDGEPFLVTATLGDGNDTIHSDGTLFLARADGGAGNDRFSGGGGTFVGGPGADDFRGGGRVDYSDSPSGVTVTLDDQANDGVPGEHDNVHADMGGLTGSAFADDLQGTDGSNYFSGGAGADTLVGRAGGDTLDGGDGNDVIDGGPGYDLISGGAGDDVIWAQDGEADYVACGDGEDTVHADAVDSVDADCETVSVSPTP